MRLVEGMTDVFASSHFFFLPENLKINNIMNSLCSSSAVDMLE
jgi:hypothetical protein